MNRIHRKTITYVIPSSAAFVRHHLPLAIEAAKKYCVHAILTRDEEDFKYEFIDHDIVVHYMDISRKSGSLLKIQTEISALKRIFSIVRPDIINAINLKAVLIAAIANRNTQTPLLGTIPGLGYMFTGDSFRKKALRIATVNGLRYSLARQKHRLALSNQADWYDVISHRITVPEHIYIVPVPGVNISQFTIHPTPKKGFRVVLPARMLWNKGIKEFVEAAKALEHKMPDAEFILAGEPDEGNPDSIPRRQLEQWSHDSVVSWLGYCDDMPTLLASSHIVCLPSTYREGVPRALVEAMACGKAVITTDMPGCRDVGKEAGIIIPPGNTEQLVSAILWLYEHPEERQKKGLAGRKKAVEQFSVETITGKMLQHYEELLR